MASQSTATTTSLSSLAAKAAENVLSQHSGQVVLEMNIPATIASPGNPDDMLQLLEILIGQSLNEMDNGELSIVAWQGGGLLELEIADSGCSIEERSASFPLAVARLHGEIVRQNCPQGGAAVTVRFPLGAVQTEAA